MTRHFTEQEREVIRRKLIEKGRELFSMLGIKKTSVDDLTQAAGISKGSFYSFFGSKEELYLDVIEAEEASIREQFMAHVISDNAVTRETIKRFILAGLHVMETNPLLRRMYDKDEFEQVLRKVPADRLAQHVKDDEDWLTVLISGWQAQGLIIDADARAIAGAIKLIIASSLLKDSIGGDTYPESIDLLVEIVAAGLVK